MVYSAGLCHLSERAPEAQEQEPDPIEEVGRQAGQILGDSAGTYQHRTEDSSQPVPLEGEITFIPEMAGVEFNPKRFSFLFQESVNRAEFRLRAANKLEGQVARGRMTVFLDSIIVAEIGLSIHVDSSRSSAAKEFVRVEQHRYRKIFAAYSHKDRVVVEALERYAQAFGDEYARDCRSLRSGEVWNKRLLELIDEADLFQLFWSSNSMRSKFVTQEWRHALSLRRDSFIRPVYWEEPMPTAPGLPPKELSELHFHWIPACSQGTESKMSSNLWQKMRPRTTRSLVGVLVFFAVAFGFLAYFPARNDWNRERIITIDTRTVPDGSSFSATISGKVNDSKTGVWVLVRPRGDNVCWVHGRAEVSN